MNATRLLLGMLLVATPALAATLRVPSEYANIQAAINAAAGGDTVLVAPGTYTGDGFHNIDFSTTTWPDPHNVVLRSEMGPELTTLDLQGNAANPRRGFVFHTGEGRESVVDGFTITNGWMSTEGGQGQMRHDLSGGGMVIRFQTGPTIRNCIFLNNHSEFSGGALETELLATPLIEDCIFMGNSSTATGGAISIETQAAPIIRRCAFTGNVAGTCGGGVSFQSWGSQFGTVEFSNCVVAGNRADIGGGIDALFPADGVVIERTIVWGNCATSFGGDVSAQAAAGFDFECSAVDSTNTGGQGTITYDANCVFTDPFFCGPEPCTNAPTTSGDYTLAENSPCLAASNTCGQLMGPWGAGCGPVTTTTHLVLADGTGDHPTIQAAIDAAIDGDTIELGDGTFVGDGNRDISFLGKALVVRSQSGIPEQCIVDCEGDAAEPHQGFRFVGGETATSVLEAITIRNGYSSGTYGGAIEISGSGPTVRGCIIVDSFALDDGGGISIRGGSGAQILDNFIMRNEANDLGGGSAIGGGGIQCSDASAILMDGNVVAFNTTPGVAGGIGVWNSTVTLRANTIALNSAELEGGGLAVTASSNVTAERLIIWGNDGLVPDIWLEGSSLDLSCSDVGANWPGPGNFSVDPRFCAVEDSNLALQANSPCLPGNHPEGADCDTIGALGEGCPASSLIDLAVVGFECSPDTAWSGPGDPDSLVISGIFENRGDDVVDNFSARIEVEGCIPFWGDTRLFGPLAPGEQDTIYATFPVQPAQCTATLIVDELDEIEEADEENNILLDVPVCVVIGTPDQPLIPSVVSLRVYPNPSSGSVRLTFGTPSPAGGQLSIYDVAGRRVWTYDVQSHRGVVPWDRRTSAGQSVAAGTYFVSFETADRTKARRLLLLR